MSELTERLEQIRDRPFKEADRVYINQAVVLLEREEKKLMIENTDAEQVERLNGRIVELLREKDALQKQLAEANRHCDVQAEAIRGLNTKLAGVRKAGQQALRQWKMYAESADPDDDFEKSAEGSVYLACKLILTGEEGK